MTYAISKTKSKASSVEGIIANLRALLQAAESAAECEPEKQQLVQSLLPLLDFFVQMLDALKAAEQDGVGIAANPAAQSLGDALG